MNGPAGAWVLVVMSSSYFSQCSKGHCRDSSGKGQLQPLAVRAGQGQDLDGEGGVP